MGETAITAIDVSVWVKAGVIAGIVTSALFLLVLCAQIVATLSTRKAAIASTTAADAAIKIGDGLLYTSFQRHQCGKCQVKPFDGWIERHPNLPMSENCSS